jgi:hypothetical protein
VFFLEPPRLGGFGGDGVVQTVELIEYRVYVLGDGWVGVELDGAEPRNSCVDADGFLGAHSAGCLSAAVGGGLSAGMTARVSV